MSGTKSADVEYMLRANDSQLESDIENANKKVEKSAKESAEETVKIEKEKTQDIKREISEVENSSRKAANKVEQSWEGSAENIKDSFEKSSDETQKKTDETGNVFENVSEIIKESLSDAATGTVPLLDKIETLTAGLSGVQAAAVGIGVAFAGVSVAGVAVANDIDSAMNDFVASTGKGIEETERYQNVLEEIYANNYGEDFQDISDAMELVVKNLGDMDDAALQSVTESAFVLRDTFEYDVAESTRAAKALMDNFGISGEEAMSMIAAGAQNGLDYSGELLDSISEYSVQFGKMGMSADDMFKVFREGAESGAFNLDKIGDAVKEFSIRAIDGSDTTKEGFELLGYSAKASAEEIAATETEIAELEKQLQYAQMEQAAFNSKTNELTKLKNADKIAEYSSKLSQAKNSLAEMTDETEKSGKSMDELIEKFGKGGEDAKEAFQEIINELMAIEDPIEQNTAGVALFGTMWEDLGPEAVAALAGIEEGAYDATGAMEQIKEVKYDDIGSMLEGLKRNVELLVVPIGEALIPLLSTLITAVLPVVSGLLGPLADLFGALLQPIVSVISTGIQPLIDMLNFLITNAIQPLINIISAVLVPIFSGALEGLLSDATSIIGKITSIFSNLISFIKNVFTGNWRGAWENVKNIFKNIFSGLATIFKAPINAIIDGWNKLVSNIGNITIPEWVPLVGGNTFSLPRISRLKVGLDYVPNDMFPAYLDEGEWVLTKDEANILRSIGGIEGIMSIMAARAGDRKEIFVTNGETPIDYESIGEAVYDAFARYGMEMKVNKRSLGRIIGEVLEERGL